MRQNIFEKQKRQMPKMTFVFNLRTFAKVLYFMKLELELDQPVVHQQSDSDRNPRSCPRQNTELVWSGLFCFPQLGIEVLVSHSDE